MKNLLRKAAGLTALCLSLGWNAANAAFYTYTGPAIGSWHTAANWSPVPPTPGPGQADDVLVPAGNRVEITTISITVRSIQNDGEVFSSSGRGIGVWTTVNGSGSFTGPGALTLTSRPFPLGGPTLVPTTVSGTFTANNLVVFHLGVGAILSQPLKVTGGVVLLAGTLVSTPPNVLTMTEYSAMDNEGAGTIQGQVKLERTLVASQFHQVCSPFHKVAVSQIGAACGTVRRHLEPTNVWQSQPSYCSTGDTMGTQSVIIGLGGAYKWTQQGTLRRGTYTINLVRTTNVGGRSAIGNPWACGLNWPAVATTGTNTSTASLPAVNGSTNGFAFVWKGSTGTFGTISSTGVLSGLVTPQIGIGQGFLVRGLVIGNQSLVIDPVTRNLVSDNIGNPDIQRKASQYRNEEVLKIGLDNGTFVDEAVAAYDYRATEGLDIFDAEKLVMENVTPMALSFMVGGEPQSIAQFPYLSNGTRVMPVRAMVNRAGTYTLRTVAIENWSDDVNMTLVDKKTGRVYDLRNNAGIAVELSEGNNDDRFEVQISASKIAGAVTGVTLYPNPAKGQFNLTLPSGVTEAQVVVVNSVGQVVVNTSSTGAISLANVAAGMYTVRIQAGETLSVQKLIVE